jgi:hypothetical protein
MKTAMHILLPSHILNMDEISWKLFGHNFITVADRGTEDVSCLFEGDPKACIISITTIDAADERLPLCVIRKWKTDRCDSNLRKS